MQVDPRRPACNEAKGGYRVSLENEVLETRRSPQSEGREKGALGSGGNRIRVTPHNYELISLAGVTARARRAS